MKEAMFTLALLVTAWVTLSIIMLWPPVSPYMGDPSNACINNLRQIQGAKEQWSLENKRTSGAVDSAGVSQYLKGGTTPQCQSGGTYTYGDLGQNPTCSLYGQMAPKPVKERVRGLGWRWKIRPTVPAGHTL